MKISLDKLREGLSLVSPAVARRATLPVLKHVLLKIEDDKMTFGANNLETAIGYTTPVSGKGDNGSVTAPFRLLSDYVNALTAEFVELTIDEERASLKLETETDEANIKGLSAEEFPSMPDVVGNQVVFSQAAFKFLTDRVVFAASTDESRPILTGVLAEFKGKDIVMAAADGLRLSRVGYTQDWEVDTEMSVIIPATVFDAVGKLCSAFPDETIEAVFGEHRVSFKVGGAVVVTQLIEGTFPDYGQIIPKTHKVKVVLEDVTEFWQAVRAVGLFGGEANVLRMSVGDGLIKLRAVSLDNSTGEAEVEAEIDGELEIGLSSKYLSDALSVMKGNGTVEILMETASSPILFGQGNSFTHVIMPMHLSGVG